MYMVIYNSNRINRKMTVKLDEVIQKAEIALSRFYKWLFYNEKYQMKFIKKMILFIKILLDLI